MVSIDFLKRDEPNDIISDKIKFDKVVGLRRNIPL